MKYYSGTAIKSQNSMWIIRLYVVNRTGGFVVSVSVDQGRRERVHDDHRAGSWSEQPETSRCEGLRLLRDRYAPICSSYLHLAVESGCTQSSDCPCVLFCVRMHDLVHDFCCFSVFFSGDVAVTEYPSPCLVQ